MNFKIQISAIAAAMALAGCGANGGMSASNMNVDGLIDQNK